MAEGDALQAATARFTVALRRLQGAMERRDALAAAGDPEERREMLLEELRRLRGQHESLSRELEAALELQSEESGLRKEALGRIDAVISELRRSLGPAHHG
ncbi:hypothetical protein [Neomegalonema perideroedes]|uniref:hypothetical protein n=1 Tax=Neomegalonema perideroedes TaxID=217219 RepID=UPI0003651247|nr:hypothetical protein [Neomegalonema perideroedes]